MSETATQSQKTKGWQLALAPTVSGVGVLFIIVMMFASYVAVGVYGATTVLAGAIITGTRVFDAITDPILGVMSDRFMSKFGRARPLILLGYAIMSFVVLAMFKLGLGAGRVWVFVIMYMIYIIGYTIFGVGAGLVGPIITKDPKQRPIYGRWATVYQTILSSSVSIVLAKTLMPKYNYQMGLPLFAELSVIVVVAAGIFVAISIFAISMSGVDVAENYVSAKKEPVKFKDAWNIIAHNRAMQMYIIAASSDKLAFQTASNSAINVMLFGILIGNYSFSGSLTFINMFVTLAILFFLVSRLAGKSGLKKAIIQWTTISLILYGVMWIFMLSVDTLQITVNPVLKVLFIIIFCASSAAKMACTCVTEPLRYDVIDYELSRSGKYMPAVVNTAYSFIDKLISSLATTIVAVVVAMIGYTSAMPQATDPKSTQILWVATFLWLGMPMLGWICTLIAMKFYPLTKEKMEEVQQMNHEVREKAKNQA